jgi:predicted PurR-regulated permease PerM
MKWAGIGARTALGVAAVGLGLWLLYLLRPVLVLVVVSIIFAQAISPVVLRLRRIGARRTQAVLSVYLAIVAAIGLLAWLLFQAVSSEFASLSLALPDIQAQLLRTAQGLPEPLRAGAESLLGGVGAAVPAEVAVPRLLDTARTVAEGLFEVMTVFVITFYWISERLIIRQLVVGLLPVGERERGLRVWDDVEEKLGQWVRGQFLLMACIGGAFALGMLIFRVKFGLLLALFAGVAEIIPLVGPYIGTIPAVLVALTQSFDLALGVAAYGAAVQILESNVLAPRILKRSTGVSQLTVVLGIVIGATLAGIPGALLAVPVAATVQVLINDLEVLRKEASGQVTVREPLIITE